MDRLVVIDLNFIYINLLHLHFILENVKLLLDKVIRGIEFGYEKIYFFDRMCMRMDLTF